MIMIQFVSMFSWLLSAGLTLLLEWLLYHANIISYHALKIKKDAISKKFTINENIRMPLGASLWILENILFATIFGLVLVSTRMQILSVLIFSISLSLVYWLYNEFFFVPIFGLTLKDPLKKTNPTLINFLTCTLQGLLIFIFYMLFSNSII